MDGAELPALEHESHGRPHRLRIFGAPREVNPKRRLGARVPVELRCAAILTHHEIEPAIVVEVT
jgi:hypothetical protein